ncbi:hypothetical protein K488DRAFT_82389 [Vararia minispora EC-137]|uniref:Uncharacterized protein n=1 Tax=Vararia minispora EC-137 TaxID=1314806 RepID=A0ACB8QWQ3_9AGAM|nr:hypothetical protein K488DRAFT_82389 [Vararia minispora EC-137]
MASPHDRVRNKPNPDVKFNGCQAISVIVSVIGLGKYIASARSKEGDATFLDIFSTVGGILSTFLSFIVTPNEPPEDKPLSPDLGLVRYWFWYRNLAEFVFPWLSREKERSSESRLEDGRHHPHSERRSEELRETGRSQTNLLEENAGVYAN